MCRRYTWFCEEQIDGIERDCEEVVEEQWRRWVESVKFGEN
jgi:hypothetical protein